MPNLLKNLICFFEDLKNKMQFIKNKRKISKLYIFYKKFIFFNLILSRIPKNFT